MGGDFQKLLEGLSKKKKIPPAFEKHNYMKTIQFLLTSTSLLQVHSLFNGSLINHSAKVGASWNGSKNSVNPQASMGPTYGHNYIINPIVTPSVTGAPAYSGNFELLGTDANTGKAEYIQYRGGGILVGGE